MNDIEKKYYTKEYEISHTPAEYPALEDVSFILGKIVNPVKETSVYRTYHSFNLEGNFVVPEKTTYTRDGEIRRVTGTPMSITKAKARWRELLKQGYTLSDVYDFTDTRDAD